MLDRPRREGVRSSVSIIRDEPVPQVTFASESFIDELAAAAERDPVAFRLDHLDDPRARAVIETVADRAGWQARVSPQRREDSAPTPRTGRGMAFARYENEFAYVAVVAEVEVSDSDGIRVRRVVVGCLAISTERPPSFKSS